MRLRKGIERSSVWREQAIPERKSRETAWIGVQEPTYEGLIGKSSNKLKAMESHQMP